MLMAWVIFIQFSEVLPSWIIKPIKKQQIIPIYKATPNPNKT